jgi:hypothetical protein
MLRGIPPNFETLLKFPAPADEYTFSLSAAWVPASSNTIAPLRKEKGHPTKGCP